MHTNTLMQKDNIMPVTHALLAAAILLPTAFANAATATRGTVYVAGFTAKQVYRVDYDYDGADTLTVSAPTILASVSNLSYGLAVTPDRYLLVAGQGQVSRIKLPTGAMSTVNPHNNCNTIVVDPAGATAWAGWKDTAISSIPLHPFADGTTHTVSGDDSVATEITFTPANGVFYTTGGEDRNGDVGMIDLATFHTTRLFSNFEATGIHYDAFSASVIFAAFGKARQFNPASPGALLSSRDDSAAGDNYIDIAPDGQGHLLATSFGGTLVLIDYSATGLIGDVSTRRVSAPMALSGATDVVYDPILFADGFEP